MREKKGHKQTDGANYVWKVASGFWFGLANKFLIQFFLKGKYVSKVGLWYPVWGHKQFFIQKKARETGKYVPKVGSGFSSR